MAPFLPVRHLPQYLRRRLVNHLNAGEIRQVPDLLGQGAVCPLYNLLKAFGICGVGHEANFTTISPHLNDHTDCGLGPRAATASSMWRNSLITRSTCGCQRPCLAR